MIYFDNNFVHDKHFIELADGTRTNGVVQGKGRACVYLKDSKNDVHKVTLNDALFIPSYKQDILSVQAVTQKGVHETFGPEKAELTTPSGIVFGIKQEGKLYFLSKIVSHSPSAETSTLREWHLILGHCNTKDVLSIEAVVEGMKIIEKDNFVCEICVKNKMSQTRNRKKEKRATKPLERVYCDLAGPITPMARDGFEYTLCLVDDYTGTNMVYFLKQKYDTVEATKKKSFRLFTLW